VKRYLAGLAYFCLRYPQKVCEYELFVRSSRP
jgi:hypothetical protein